MVPTAARTLAAAALALATGAGVAAHAATAPAAAQARDVRVTAAATTYNDPSRPGQWAMTRLGAEALHARRTAAGVVVAVIDSGVQGDHPDLKGHLVPGYDFVTNTVAGAMHDGYGHGTHVAGIVTATANNATGVAGLAPEAKIMPLRVLDDQGAGWGSAVARALVFAADHGAKIANVSMASAYSQPVADAVTYAQSKGVIVVAAVGNERQQGSPVAYPAALPGVIGVAADDAASKDASFSSTGRVVDVTAPGVSILSTYKGSTYQSMSGTSMATPYVSATLAVMAAARPGITADRAQRALALTARDLGPHGYDTATGAGEIRPLRAVCSLVRC